MCGGGLEGVGDCDRLGWGKVGDFRVEEICIFCLDGVLAGIVFGEVF